MPKNWLVMQGDGPAAPYRARLAGAGRRLPDTVLTTDELMASTRHHTHIDLERPTSIRERRVSTGEEDSYSLATSAALDCLDKAQQQAAALTTHAVALVEEFEAGRIRPGETVALIAPAIRSGDRCRSPHRGRGFGGPLWAQ